MTLAAEFIDRTVFALTEPSVIYLKNTFLLVKAGDPCGWLALTFSIYHSSNSSMISMNCSIFISNVDFTTTLSREIQLPPLSSNLSGHDVHWVALSEQVLQLVSHTLQIPVALPLSLARK